MSYPFAPQRGLVIARTEIHGPTGAAFLRLALDTGATSTVINVSLLVALGYDPALSPQRLQVTTGSGVEYAPLVMLSRIRSLGQERADFPVLAHTLPPSAGVDGLLGLDFLRGYELVVDFRKGQVILS
jgi:predicted aspartyl protease